MMAEPLHTPRPIPLPRKIPETAVDRHRDVWCRHYGDCLDQACERGWTSWSCRGCPLRGTCQVKPELRTGGDCALADAEADAMGGPWSRRQTHIAEQRPPVAWLWGRLRDRARPVEDIAGPYSLARTREALGRFADQGIAEADDAGRWRRSGKRRCRGCRQLLPREAFGRNGTMTDELQSRCKECSGGRKA